MRTLRSRAWTYLVLVSLGLLCALPNVLPQRLTHALPGWYAASTITLGLDLRGGSHLLMQVDTSALADEETFQFAERLATELGAREARRLTHGVYVIRLLDAAGAVRAQRLGQELSGPVEGGGAVYSLEVQGNALRIEPTTRYASQLARDAVERSLEIVRQRLDATGVVEPTVSRQGNDAIIVQLPGVDDPARIRELLGTTAKLTFHLAAADGARATLTLPGTVPGEGYAVEKRVALDGTNLSDARVGFDPNTGDPVVHFELNREGARRFGDITAGNIGRPLAIVVDDRVISAPVIRTAIAGGSGEISGGFTVAEASDLALLLRAGALPAPLEVVEERTVGPDLGRDAIEMGLAAGLVGAALVVGCMLVLYGRWGLIANSALLVNVALIFGVLSLLGATLTLPGIAGIVLAIGMAVDANILINERIREETRRGLRPMAALEAGFKRAFTTILDSCVTTLIATSLLFAFGSGPVRGFAVTMAVGLGTSMFTAVAVTRVLMEWRVRRLGRAPLSIGGIDLGGRLGAGTAIPFMRARLAGLTASAVISIAALVLLVQPGLSLGVDFAGGAVMEVHAGEAVTAETVRGALAGRGLADVTIQDFGKPGDFLLRAPEQAAGASGTVVLAHIRSAMTQVSAEATFPRVEMVGPSVSESFLQTAVLAMLLASFGMLGYLWLRFEWPFAVAAIATLGLDLTKMLGFLALSGIEFNLTAVAALLTLVGYSVNDKVVIFDRIRELLREEPDQSQANLRRVFDLSITATLPRTLFTSATTFLAILPMAVFGGAAVASFALPMLFGVALCTSSSILVAAPIVLVLAKRYTRSRRLFEPPPVEESGSAVRSGVRRRRPRSLELQGW